MSITNNSSPSFSNPHSNGSIPQRSAAAPQNRVIAIDSAAPRRAMTEREKHVLRLICDGLTNSEMAVRLGISTETVKSELKRIFRKIEVRNRTQAAVLLVKQGMA